MKIAWWKSSMLLLHPSLITILCTSVAPFHDVIFLSPSHIPDSKTASTHRPCYSPSDLPVNWHLVGCCDQSLLRRLQTRGMQCMDMHELLPNVWWLDNEAQSISWQNKHLRRGTITDFHIGPSAMLKWWQS